MRRLFSRRDAARLLLGAGLAAPALARADSLKQMRPYRIVMILYRGETDGERGFRDYFQTFGIPVDITVIDLDRDMTSIRDAIAKARAAKPDLIYTWGTGIAIAVLGTVDGDRDRAADRAITDIPVVFNFVTSPVGSRLLARAGASGRNFTGVSHVAEPDVQLRAMQSYRSVSRLAVIYNPVESNSVLIVKRLNEISEAAHIELISEPVPLNGAGLPIAEAIPGLVAKVSMREPQFLYIGPDTFIGDNRDVLTSEAIARGVPVFTGTELEIRTSNAMLGLVAPYAAIGQFAASKAAQILVEGRAPGDIPVETLQRFVYLVKIAVAKRLGMFPPLGLVDFAEIAT